MPTNCGTEAADVPHMCLAGLPDTNPLNILLHFQQLCKELGCSWRVEISSKQFKAHSKCRHLSQYVWQATYFKICVELSLSWPSFARISEIYTSWLLVAICAHYFHALCAWWLNKIRTPNNWWAGHIVRPQLGTISIYSHWNYGQNFVLRGTWEVIGWLSIFQRSAPMQNYLIFSV